MARVWDLTTGTLRTTLTGHDKPVRAVACTTIGNQPVAITTSRDRLVRVWDLTDGTLRATLTSNDSWLTAVACTTVDGHPVAVTMNIGQKVRVVPGRGSSNRP